MATLGFNRRIGTVSNLPTGGTYDLLLVAFKEGFPESQLTFDLGLTPRKVTGVQKVAQMFLKILFTSKGSNVFYPNQGTLFSNYILNANRGPSDSVLYAEINAQITDATAQTRAILNIANTDPASQLASITVLGFDVGKESVVIYLSMTTNAGVEASLAVPFPQLDMQLSDQRSPGL